MSVIRGLLQFSLSHGQIRKTITPSTKIWIRFDKLINDDDETEADWRRHEFNEWAWSSMFYLIGSSFLVTTKQVIIEADNKYSFWFILFLTNSLIRWFLFETLFSSFFRQFYSSKVFRYFLWLYTFKIWEAWPFVLNEKKYVDQMFYSLHLEIKTVSLWFRC